MTDLTRDVIRYQQTGQGLGPLVDRISRIAYAFPASQSGFSREDGAEFLLQFLPRISRLVRRFKDTGQPFESYLASTLRWQIRTLASDRADGKILTVALHGAGSDMRYQEAERADLSATEVHECAALSRLPVSRESLLSKGQRNRLIYLSLKMAEHLGETDYRRIAVATGCSAERLLDCWHCLRDWCRERRDRRHRFEEYRDRAWFEIRCLQCRMQMVLENEEREALARKLAMWRRRHLQTRRLLSRMHDGPSHAEIARVVGVPKGTVDSSVFYAKRELQDPAYRELLARMMADA